MSGPAAASHLRLARPVSDLAAAEHFWAAGLGLSVLWRSDDGLLAVGWPGAAWHLELVHEPGVLPTPTEEDLLVLYLDGPVDPVVVARLLAAGGSVVPSRNPYWDQWGVTVADPDGYRLVLCERSWST